MTKPIEFTLFDLIQQVGKWTDDDKEVALNVAGLVNSGRVRLRGKFAGARIALPPPLSDFQDEIVWPLLPHLPGPTPYAERTNQDACLAA